MTADDIRAGLRDAAKRRAEADKRHAHATADLVRFLQAASESKEISQTEAAELGGVTRTGAWGLLKGASK